MKEINWNRLDEIFKESEQVLDAFNNIGLTSMEFWIYINDMYKKHKIQISSTTHKIMIDNVIDLSPKSCRIDGVECTTILQEDKYVDMINEIFDDVYGIFDMDLVMNYIENMSKSKIDKVYEKHNRI